MHTEEESFRDISFMECTSERLDQFLGEMRRDYKLNLLKTARSEEKLTIFKSLSPHVKCIGISIPQAPVNCH